MSLSEHEQDLLRQMESRLREDDPKLVSAFSQAHKNTFSATQVIFGLLFAIFGLFLLLFAVHSKLIWLGVVGFLLMFFGLVWVSFRSFGQGVKAGNFSKGKQQQATGSSFFNNLEKRWDERKKD